MSHSQFHSITCLYLDMHGLIFETSICYWQDQPGDLINARIPPAKGVGARRHVLALELPQLSK